MSLEIVTVPCLRDNYAYLAHDPATGTTAVIDAPEAAPILAALAERGWRADLLLLTHHHDDHIAGAEALWTEGARIEGAFADTHRLPPLDRWLRPGDAVQIGSQTGTVIDASGHTVGHIAFHFPESAAVFTGDSLMALGCGRLFEGDAAMMWGTLSRLMALPSDTLVCSGHEYTAANARFALTIEPENPDLQARAADIAAARAAGQPTVPALLSLELATNPFLRADTPAVRAATGLPDAPAAEVFAELRRRKDAF